MRNKLFVALAEQLQEQREQVDEVEIELERAEDCFLADRIPRLIGEVAVLDLLCVPRGQADKDDLITQAPPLVFSV